MFLRTIVPIAETAIGVLATVAWIGLIGYGVFVLTKWGLVALADVIL